MRRASKLICILLAVTVVACAELTGSTTSTLASGPETTSTVSNLGGDGLPVQQPGEVYGHFSSSISGRLQLEGNGCWVLSFGGEARLIAFPEGFEKGEDGVTMVSSDGTVFEHGQPVDAVGGITAVESLPGVPDGYWGNYISFCDPSANEIVVADDLSAAFDPAALSPGELVELVRSAELTESWGCGLGFTLSSVDQQVALYLSPTDYDSLPVSPVTFPDPAWNATLVVGKDLMVNHCDDVAEYWEPERVVAAEWPVATGTLTFDPNGVDLAPCGGSGPVQGTIDNLVVETPGGTIDLGNLSVVNDAYGCFAG